MKHIKDAHWEQYEIADDDVWVAFEEIDMLLGHEELLKAIVESLDTSTLGETLAYICKEQDFTKDDVSVLKIQDDEKIDDTMIHDSVLKNIDNLKIKILKTLHDSNCKITSSYPYFYISNLTNINDSKKVLKKVFKTVNKINDDILQIKL